jgi:hypothetical protein
MICHPVTLSFFCEEKKGAQMPVIGKYENSSLGRVGSTRKQDWLQR